MHADGALVTRALEGERAAAEALVRRLMPVVQARVRRARRRAGAVGGRDAEDLCQEVWAALLAEGGRRLLAFDPAKGATLEGFVGVLAEREVVSLARHGAAKKRGGHLFAVEVDDGVATEAPSPEQVVESKDLAARLGAHLDEALPERGQLVLRYAFADGRPAPEVADILGVKVQVVYNWQHKIRGLARRFLSA